MQLASELHGWCIPSSARRGKPRRHERTKILSCLLFAAALAALACDRDKQTIEVQPPAALDPSLQTPTFPPDSGPPPTIDANRAMQYTKEIVKLGPRPLGSANHKKVEDDIHSHLKGDQVEDDSFTADTPVGKFPVHNIVAKYPGTKDGIILIASHYDTNYPLRDTSYIGANDGASSSALLLEFANQLRGKTRDGYSVWLTPALTEHATEVHTLAPSSDASEAEYAPQSWCA